MSEQSADTVPMEPDDAISAAAYLEALAVEFEEGVLGGAAPEKIAARLREIAALIDGSNASGGPET